MLQYNYLIWKKSIQIICLPKKMNSMMFFKSNSILIIFKFLILRSNCVKTPQKCLKICLCDIKTTIFVVVLPLNQEP